MTKEYLHYRHYESALTSQHVKISIEYAISVLEDMKDVKPLSPTVWERCNEKISELKSLINQ